MYDSLYVKFLDTSYSDYDIHIRINKDLYIDSFENISYGTYINYNDDINNNISDVQLPGNRVIYGDDIHLSYNDGTREIIIDKSMYTLYTKSNSSDEFIEVTDMTLPLNEYVRVLFNDSGVYNNFDLKLNIIKTEFADNNVTFTYDENYTLCFNINRKYNNDLSHFLVFSGGLLLPSDKYTISINDDINGPHRIYIHNDALEYIKGDKVSIVYSPNKYYNVYQNNVSSSTRYVNLSGKINKPLNLKWYDIYVDGHQLFSENIDIFSCYKFFTHGIAVKNSVTIMQKNLDPPPYGVLDEKINDNILSYVLSKLDELLLYIMTLHELLNPDLHQFDDEMIRRYTFLFDEFNNLFINPDEEINTSSDFGVYRLSDIDEDHDIRILPSY